MGRAADSRLHPAEGKGGEAASEQTLWHIPPPQKGPFSLVSSRVRSIKNGGAGGFPDARMAAGGVLSMAREGKSSRTIP